MSNLPRAHLGKRKYHKLIDKFLLEKLVGELEKNGIDMVQ